MNNGHPVYFVIFYTDPIPGQTVSDVQKAQVRFVEEVVRRHPHAPAPAVIGNCQAGWAAALVGADRPDVTGPLIFNGSPLSYWAGVEGKNPMRYRGGLLGGVWLTSFASDLGNGKFDGANLVAGFEDLNPANTYWTKQYNLYAKVDTEETLLIHQPSKRIKRTDYIQMVREQSRILQSDPDQAIATLPKLIKTSKDRQRAMVAAQEIVFADRVRNSKEEAVWARIRKALRMKI